MKDKNITADIQRYDMIGGRHWYVSFHSGELGFTDELIYKWKKFDDFKDARTHAMKYVLAKNITVYD